MRRNAALLNASVVVLVRAHGMGAGSGKFLKLIFPPAAIEPLTELCNAIRDYNYTHTLPWTDEGYRILPAAIHDEYTNQMRTLRAKYEAAQAAFLTRMPEWEQWARENHNGTFEPKLYEARKVERKFGFRVDFQPVPCADDFRVAVDQETKQALNERLKAAEEFATADLWHRLADPLARMVERLSQPDATFRNSLVGNIAEIVALVPRLNLSGDPALAALAREAEALGQLAPQTLRDDKTVRAQTAANAKAILDKMSSYMPPAAAAE